MLMLQTKEAIDKRSIAVLAEEFAMPLAEISVLYETQRTRLMQGATVGKYFSIIAVRNIRQQLAQERASLLQTH